MNTRMERLIPEDAYGNEPTDSRAPVDFEIAVVAVAEALDRIMAEIAKARGAA